MKEKVKKVATEKPKKCREKNCAGIVNLSVPISLQTSCHSYSSAFACNTCGRLHWLQKNKRVSGVKNRRGGKAFYKDDILSNKSR